jgi:predicted O-methyltransferase YrrM
VGLLTGIKEIFEKKRKKKMRPEIRELALQVKGFLTEDEGMTLFRLAAETSAAAPCLEIGSYCGKSSLFLAEGCRIAGQHPLFCVDHHEGSEEQQYGQEYFDPDLYDKDRQIVDTLPLFMDTIRKTDLLEWIIPVITTSARFSRYMPVNSLSLVFIDGGHSEKDVFADYNNWSPKIKKGGYLCVHDIFPNPANGGQAPYFMFEYARKSGDWDYVEQVETLGILKRR